MLGGRGPFTIPRLVLVAVLLFGVASCAAPTTERIKVADVALALEKKKQREFSVREYIDDFKRLQSIGFRVLRAGAPSCKDTVRTATGAGILNVYSVEAAFRGKAWRKAAVSVLDASEIAKVGYVIEGSPAARAGLRAGDIPMEIDGWTVPVNEKAVAEIEKKLRPDAGEPIRAVKMKVRRNQSDLVLSVTPDKVCDYQIVLEKSDELNAFADGKRILISQRMMEFARTDDELAVVIGHELAHNYMKHIEAKQQNAVAAGVAGFLVDLVLAAGGVNTGGEFTNRAMNMGARAYSQDFEAEADYVGLYAVARAGFDIGAAPRFWRRMASRNVKAIDYASTHPTTAYRSAALEKIIAEIERKKAANLPLEPNLKKIPKPPPAASEDAEPDE